ncbi:hypothetical protein [Phenylobacterium sp.]|uniref:hypothetical protein n=1 Tax=Phenylobacterium sp. TaxID=1871053 RepID=UPI002E35537B|nr:hypothetical protein [Phenylobacterium sp.]HEX2559820.1 hypothetical protein [Phenylobacterium sp.]
MSLILYPVADNADAAMAAPRGRAAREREAAKILKGQAVFETQLVGPGFSTREAALDAYAGKVEDDRPGRVFSPPPEDRWLRIVEVVAPDEKRAPKPVRPAYKDGKRWPEPPPAPRTVWRLSVSYWRPAAADQPLDGPQARLARRKAQDLDRDALRALTRQPLRPVKPQQGLDIGLFETRLPENPHIIVPDE